MIGDHVSKLNNGVGAYARGGVAGEVRHGHVCVGRSGSGGHSTASEDGADSEEGDDGDGQ